MPQVVQGLPPQMGTWLWSYTPGHGYTGRHAYSESNPELSLPVRQIYQIRKNPQAYKEIIQKSLARRDVILEIHDDYEWQHRTWRTIDFQFSTGALRFIENLPPETYLFITVTGAPRERYFSLDSKHYGDEYPSQNVITRTCSGYGTASFYSNTATFYQQATLPGYQNFEPIFYFSVHYEV